MFVPPSRQERLLRLVKAYPIALNFFLTNKGGHSGLSRKQPDFPQARYNEFRAEILDVAYNNDNNEDDSDDPSTISQDKDLVRILDSFEKGTNTPLIILTCLSEGIVEAQTADDNHSDEYHMTMDGLYVREMEGQIQRLASSTGEGLLRTPIPTGFTRHTSRLLGAWSYYCPFMLYSYFGVWTPPGAVLCTYAILALEDIGVTLEEPFHVLPLRQYSDGIADSVNQIASTYDPASRMVVKKD